MTKQTGALGSTIVTESRRRKSPDVVNSKTVEPVPSCGEQALTQQSVNLSLTNEELEKERASVSRLQNEIEKEREANLRLPVLHSDLRRLQSELQALQANLVEEQQARQRLEEELLQSRRTCAELKRSLENERLLSQSNQQAVQTKDETIRKQMLQLKQERGLKFGLEKTVRGLQAEVEEERIRRGSTERELLEERKILQQNSETLEREREIYEQRIHESERTLADSERCLGELQNEIEKEREANSLLPVLRSDLRSLQSELQDTQAVRNMLEQQLSEKEVNFRALQANLGKEQQARQRLEEELLQSRRTCAELERSLENER